MSETPTMQPCGDCGHALSIHDTGWDAAGCMVNECRCRYYCEPTLGDFIHRKKEAMSETLQAERDALRAKLEEKGRVFSENLLMQGEEITRLRAEVERLRLHMDGCGRTTYNLAKSAEKAEAALRDCRKQSLDLEQDRDRLLLSMERGKNGSGNPCAGILAARDALRDTAPREEE